MTILDLNFLTNRFLRTRFDMNDEKIHKNKYQTAI